MPTPIGLISDADSKIRHRIFAWCSASASVSPPMPAPTMMTSSPMAPPGTRSRGVLGGGYNRLVSLLSIWGHSLFEHDLFGNPLHTFPDHALRGLHKAHAHARGRIGSLADEPPGAGPGQKTPVIAAASAGRAIAMCAPAIAVFRAGKFLRTAQLRPAGKALGIIRRPAIPQRGKDVAAAGLIAEEMRRGRHHRGIGRLGRHPVDARKM